MKPVSGKIDRERLPHSGSSPEKRRVTVKDASRQMPGQGAGGGQAARFKGMSPECEEVLAICRSDMPLGLDHGFAEAGAHSAPHRSPLAETASGRMDTCRSERCSVTATLRRPPPRPPTASEESTAAVKTEATTAERPADVLSIRHLHLPAGTVATLLYFPLLLAFVGAFALPTSTWRHSSRPAPFRSSWSLSLSVHRRPRHALRQPALDHDDQILPGGARLQEQRDAGRVPQVEQDASANWCIGRLEGAPAIGDNVSQCPADGIRVATARRNRRREPSVRARRRERPGPLDLITIGDHVAIQTGAYIQTTRWSGQHLHVGPVRLECGCKIGLRAADFQQCDRGPRTWITPFTPILTDVGAQEMWKALPRRSSGRYTQLKRAAIACQYVHPIWLLEPLNVLMQVFFSFCLVAAPTAAILWFARDLIAAEHLAGEFPETPSSRSSGSTPSSRLVSPSS